MAARPRRSKQRPPRDLDRGDPCLLGTTLPPGREFERFAPCDCGHEGNLTKFLESNPTRMKPEGDDDK